MYSDKIDPCTGILLSIEKKVFAHTRSGMCQLKRIVVEKVKAEREREKEVRRAVYLLTSSSSSVNSQEKFKYF